LPLKEFESLAKNQRKIHSLALLVLRLPLACLADENMKADSENLIVPVRLRRGDLYYAPKFLLPEMTASLRRGARRTS
jgi:hypothetical protein